MVSTKIKDVEIPNSGFALKDLRSDRLLVMGCRHGKELAIILDINNPESWVLDIKTLLGAFELS